jgi:hypothetical protein
LAVRALRAALLLVTATALVTGKLAIRGLSTSLSRARVVSEQAATRSGVHRKLAVWTPRTALFLASGANGVASSRARAARRVVRNQTRRHTAVA